MIFLTVGTYPLPFNRLIRRLDELVAEGKVKESVLAQTGYATYTPRFMTCVKMMEKAAFDEAVSECSAIISHAGLGTIMAALEHQKPILVVPRLPALKEVVNNHQVHTAHRFADGGHVLAAFNTQEIESKLALLGSFRPNPRIATPNAVADGVAAFLQSLLR